MHPLHPISLAMMISHPSLIHFPIAILTIEVALILFWIGTLDQAYLRFAKYTFVAGYITLLPAIITGFIDVRNWGGVNGIVGEHFYVSLLLIAVCSFRLFFWIKIKESYQHYRMGHLATSGFVAFLVLLTGFTGGSLIH